MKCSLLCLSLVSVLLIFMAGCGGGGSSSAVTAPSSISGIAAAGAPVNGKVTLMDKNGVQRSGTIGVDGKFTIDTKALSSPFVLKAEGLVGGQPCKLFSAAALPGTIHINPFTNLILAVAIGGDPSLFFGSAGTPDTSKLNEAALLQARQKVRALLLPLLNLYGVTDFNPESGTYVADPGYRLDAMLEIVSISIGNDGTFVIVNKLSGAVLASGNVLNLSGITLEPGNAPDTSILDDLAKLTERLASLCSLLNQGAGMTQQGVEDFFVADPNYRTSNQMTRLQDVASIFTVWGAGGLNTNGKLKSIRNMRLVGDLTSSYWGRGVSRVFLVNFDFIFENGTRVPGSNVTFGKETAGGTWKFIGDPDNSSGGGNSGGIFTSGGVEIIAIVPPSGWWMVE